MAWFAANWFWILILVAFIAAHVFGHGGHGGHGGHSKEDPQQSRNEKEQDAAQRHVVNTGSTPHQH